MRDRRCQQPDGRSRRLHRAPAADIPPPPAGGYAYRLCKMSPAGEPTEDCFQKARLDEGAVSFYTVIFVPYMDSTHKREWARLNDRTALVQNHLEFATEETTIRYHDGSKAPFKVRLPPGSAGSYPQLRWGWVGLGGVAKRRRRGRSRRAPWTWARTRPAPSGG